MVAEKTPAELTFVPVHVPPRGLGFRMIFGAFKQTILSIPAFTGVGSEIVKILESLLVHPFALVKVYVRVNVPIPFGVNRPLGETFSPLHVPPAGVAPSWKGSGWLHAVLSGPAFTAGNGLTVIFFGSLEEHPFASVNV